MHLLVTPFSSSLHRGFPTFLVGLAKRSSGTEFNIHPSVFSENKYKDYPFKQRDCAFQKKNL